MYKDFKKSESLDTGFVGGSGIIWMFSGIVLGLLVGLGMYYFANQNKSNENNGINTTQTTQESESEEGVPAVTAATVANTTTAEEKANPSAEKSMSIIGDVANTEQPPSQEASKKHENKFSYYAVLPTLDVPVSSAKAVDTSAVQNNSQAIKKAVLRKGNNTEETEGKKGRGHFLLQIASFKRKNRANRARKTLSRRGIKARVQKKKIRGRLWYRIVAGPVDKSNANLWKKKAEKLGHHPIISPVR